MISVLRTGAIVLMTLAALLASFFTSGLTQALIELIAFFSLLGLALTRPSPLVQ